MLIGQYEAKVDSKGRAALPKKFREILGDKLIITLGYEKSLIVVSEENWKALLEGTQGRPFIDSATRETQRFLLGSASSVELDDKGRFIFPGYLREHGKIKEDVVFVGLSRYVEIWSKEVWEEYRTVLVKNIDTISQRLVDKEKRENE
jgi:MraZ protein